MLSAGHSQSPISISLSQHGLYLARNSSIRFYAKTAEFFRNAGAAPSPKGGRVLALYHPREIAGRALSDIRDAFG